MKDKRAYKKAWYEKNKVRISRKGKKYYQKYKDAIKKRASAYYYANRQAIRKKTKAYYLRTRAEHIRRATRWQAENKERSCLYHIPRRFGISIDEYCEIREKQKWKCIICKQRPKKRRLGVDHNHQTGHIRGLLCSNCNAGLGMFKDDASLLRAALHYLKVRDK